MKSKAKDTQVEVKVSEASFLSLVAVKVNLRDLFPAMTAQAQRYLQNAKMK